MEDSAAGDPLRFGRGSFWAGGLTDFDRALRISCVRCCNREVLWPRCYLPKLADRLCRQADVLGYLNSHRVWKAPESYLEGSNASWFVPHFGFSRFGFLQNGGAFDQFRREPKPAGAPCASFATGSLRDQCCRGTHGPLRRFGGPPCSPMQSNAPRALSGTWGSIFAGGLWDTKGCAGPVGRIGCSGAGRGDYRRQVPFLIPGPGRPPGSKRRSNERSRPLRLLS